MYFYTPKGRRGYVSATDLAKFMFCPRFFLLSKILPKKKNEAMEKGRKLHEEAFRVHIRNARPLSIEEAVKLGKTTRVEGREVWISDGLVHGIIDRIVIERNRATVIEYKSGKSVESPVSKNQAIIYGVLTKSFVEDVVVEVRDFEERVYGKVRIEEGHIELVRNSVLGYRIAVARGVFPSLDDERCEVCPLREVCWGLEDLGMGKQSKLPF